MPQLCLANLSKWVFKRHHMRWACYFIKFAGSVEALWDTFLSFTVWLYSSFWIRTRKKGFFEKKTRFKKVPFYSIFAAGFHFARFMARVDVYKQIVQWHFGREEDIWWLIRFILRQWWVLMLCLRAEIPHFALKTLILVLAPKAGRYLIAIILC